ncbi:glycosyltransferase family 2 protein [Cryobacterium sp. TmT3-12]|uniref:glycosyltransferase family 2 protein n=1 Tax=Cryobacterium sp. TmT3-12 TaxID=1259266 RepID=UPI002410DCA0|nr:MULTISPECIES: glycosyltransferase family 2 protein [Cryobacterium]
MTYNQQDIVLDTIESCLNQTYGNYEIVVSDDGSTDATPTILRELKTLHPNAIKLVLNPENSGITANCNAGLSACSGEFIALMGGDDLLLPSKLSEQVTAFQNDPELVLSYHPCHVLRNGVMSEVVGGRRKDVVTGFLDVVGKFGAQMPGPATMVRSSAIPAGGFNDEICTASDWLFQIDVSSQGHVARIDTPLAIYRQDLTNVGQRYFSYSDDFLKTLTIVEERYGSRPGIHSAVRRGARRFLLGITYRALEQDRPDLAVNYGRELTNYSPKFVSGAVVALARVPGTGSALRAAKSFLKRYV